MDGRSIYYKIAWNLRNLIQMMNIYQDVFRRGLYIDYIFTSFLGNNCITMSRMFWFACLEKCILEIALAAIKSLFFKKLQVNLFKKRLQQGFLVNIEKFVRAPFSLEHVWWLLLRIPWHLRFIWKIGAQHVFVLAIETQPCDAVLLCFRNYRYAGYKQLTW